MLVACLKPTPGLQFDLHQGSQDSSFHASLSGFLGDVSRGAKIFVQLSNFGSLASVWEEVLSHEHLQAVLGCLSQSGYLYIPSDVLAEPYDGAIESFKGDSWYHRFFDYN